MRQIPNTFRKHSLLPGLVFLLAIVFATFAMFKAYSFDDYHQLDSIYVLRLKNAWRIGLSVCTLVATLLLFYNALKKSQVLEVSLHQLAFIFSMFMAYEPYILLNVEVVFTFLFNVLSLIVLLQIHNQAEISPFLFKSALFAGIATLIYLPNGAMVILLFCGAIILRPLSIRNTLNLLIGFVLPLIYYFGVAYLFDLNPNFIHNDLLSRNSINFMTIGVALSDSTTVGLLVLSFIGAISAHIKRANLVVNQRNQLTIIFLSWAIFSFLFFFKHPIFIIPTGLISSAFIAGLYKASRLKFLMEILLIATYSILLFDLL